MWTQQNYLIQLCLFCFLPSAYHNIQICLAMSSLSQACREGLEASKHTEHAVKHGKCQELACSWRQGTWKVCRKNVLFQVAWVELAVLGVFFCGTMGGVYSCCSCLPRIFIFGVNVDTENSNCCFFLWLGGSSVRHKLQWRYLRLRHNFGLACDCVWWWHAHRFHTLFILYIIYLYIFIFIYNWKTFGKMMWYVAVCFTIKRSKRVIRWPSPD